MKTIINFIIAISTTALLCFSCTHSDKPSNPMNHSPKTITQLKQEIVETGDTSAYNSLAIQLLDFKYGDEDLLPYAMIMANQYEYPQAYFDVFSSMTAPYMNNINQIDSLTAQLAIKYLLVASEKGHGQASEIVEAHSITENQDAIKQLDMIFQ